MYRESARPSATVLEKEGRDFTNMVIFCTATKVDKVTFRTPVQQDYLGTRARKAFLVPKHEVPGSRFKEQVGDGGVLLRNGTERFKGWQQKSALGHWDVMRTVLPSQIWESW